VLVYDGIGSYPAMDAAEVLANQGANVHFATCERTIAPDVGSSNSPAYLKVFASRKVETTMAHILTRVVRSECGKLKVELYSEYADNFTSGLYDFVVMEGGTMANDEAYYALVDDSINLGEVDYDALLNTIPQNIYRNESGKFYLYR